MPIEVPERFASLDEAIDHLVNNGGFSVKLQTDSGAMLEKEESFEAIKGGMGEDFHGRFETPKAELALSKSGNSFHLKFTTDLSEPGYMTRGGRFITEKGTKSFALSETRIDKESTIAIATAQAVRENEITNPRHNDKLTGIERERKPREREEKSRSPSR